MFDVEQGSWVTVGTQIITLASVRAIAARDLCTELTEIGDEMVKESEVMVFCFCSRTCY